MRARLYQTGKTLQLDGKPQEIIAVMRNLQQDAATKQKPVPDKTGLDDTGLRCWIGKRCGECAATREPKVFLRWGSWWQHRISSWDGRAGVSFGAFAQLRPAP